MRPCQLYRGKMDGLEIIMFSEVSQMQRQILCIFSNMWNLDLKMT
jgi:hypothetical protein